MRPQEEAYIWGRYFNQSSLADTVLNAILAYDPAVPSWAYNGASLSYGDVGNNAYDPWNATTHSVSYPLGSGTERVSGHYRAGLNAVPLLAEYKRNPDGMYLLRLAVGGITNCLPNIGARLRNPPLLSSRDLQTNLNRTAVSADADGAASMGFHLSPANLKFDEYSGDWGVGFFGAARHAGAFLVEDPELGQLCFLCDVVDGGNNDGAEGGGGGAVLVKPRDAWHKKLFVGSLGVEIISEAGRIESLAVSSSALVVTFEDVAQQPLVSVLRLRVEQPAMLSGNRPALDVAPSRVGDVAPPLKRGAWEIAPAPGGKTTVVTLSVAPAQ